MTQNVDWPSLGTMPKVSKMRGGSQKRSPYSRTENAPKAANNIFKLNTGLGQHVLKNPGVAQAIVDKADLKQSDVRILNFMTDLS